MGKSSLALKTKSWAEFLRTICRKLCVLPIKYRPFNREKILKSRHWKMKWVRYPLVDTENNNETRQIYTTDHYINRAKALFIHINSLLMCIFSVQISIFSYISLRKNWNWKPLYFMAKIRLKVFPFSRRAKTPSETPSRAPRRLRAQASPSPGHCETDVRWQIWWWSSLRVS